MRHRVALSVISLLAAAALIGACTDRSGTKGLPTAPRTLDSKDRDRRGHDSHTGLCVDFEVLESLTRRVFTGRSPDARSVLGKLENLERLLRRGKVAEAQDLARDIVAFIEQKAREGRLSGTPAQRQQLIDGILCNAGILPDTFLVYPTDQPQVIVSDGGQSGIFLPGHPVDVPTLITITVLPPTSAPLDTKLDKYPNYVELTSSSPLSTGVVAVVGVCPDPTVPGFVRERLRLGHQASTGFEITPPAAVDFLTCPSSVALGPVGSALRSLAKLVLPRPVYAQFASSGGVGGTATEFSPFGPVDPVLEASGGVGGTATEFLTMPAPDSAPAPTSSGPRLPTHARVLVPGKRFNLTIAGVCVSVDALFGTPLDVACRPVLTLKTRLGTIMENVPVGWAIELGGGVTAPEVSATHACGITFGASAATATDASGKASVCWNLGSTPGTNTIKATPTAGGDAPVGVTFSPPHFLFTATALAITPTATATGGSFVYNALGQPGSGTCSNGLTPVLTYSSESVPVNVGSYTLTVTCGAGDPLYTAVAATATITITQATITAAAGSGGLLTYPAPIPTLPCTISGLMLPLDAGIVSCTTLIPPISGSGVYITTPIVTPSSLPNYAIVLRTGEFKVP